MADDTLVVGSRFDPTGLDAGLIRGIAQIQNFADLSARIVSSLPPVTFNTTAATRSLDAARDALARVSKEAQDLGPLTNFTTTDAQREVAELAHAFEGVQGAVASIDPTGVLRRVASDTEAAVREMQKLQAAAAQPTGLVGGQPIVTRDKVAELQTLAGQLQQIPAIEDEAATGLARLNAGFAGAAHQTTELSRASRDAISGAERMATGIAAASAGSRTLASGFEASHRASNLLRTGMVSLASQAIGTESALASVAQAGLFAAGGTTAVLAIAAVVVAYQKLTRVAREAREERDKLFAQGQQRIAGADQAGGGAFAELAAASKRLLDLGRARADLEADIERKIGLTVAGRAKQVALEQVINDQAKTRAVVEQLNALLAVEATKARIEATRQALTDELSLQQAVLRTAAIQVKALADQAAQRQQTFQAQPGFISQQELRAFGERVTLAKAETAATVQSLTAQRELARQQEAFTDAEIASRQARIDALTRAIELGRIEGAQAVQAIRDEQRLLSLTRERVQLEADHAQRVVRAGGGNLLGQNPATIPVITLPTPADIDKLRQELQKLPPIGLPTAADWAAAAKAGLPPILQGARQQGLVSGEGDAAQARIRNAKDLAAAMRDAESAILSSVTATFRLGDAFQVALGGAVNLSHGIAEINQANKAFAAAAGDNTKELAAQLAKVSGIVGVITSAISIIGGIGSKVFGPSAFERERDRILQQNTERLAELRISLDKADFGGVAGQEKALDVLSRLSGLRDFGGLFATGRDEAVQRALDAAGLSITEFAKLVEQASGGIDILNNEGQLIGSAFEQAESAIQDMIAASLKFSDAITDAAKQAFDEKLRIARGGQASAVQDLTLNRRLLLQGLSLAPGTEHRIANLNLDTPEGRRAYADWIAQIEAMADAGKLTKEELGAFVNDVDGLFGTLSGGLDDTIAANREAAEKARELADAANAAAEAARQMFKDTLPTLLSLQGKLTGQTAPADLFRQAFEGLAFQAPDLAKLFGGFDLNDPASREALRKKMLDLVQQMMGGPGALDKLGITPEQFQPLLDFLNIGADALDKFKTAVEKATLAEAQAAADLRARLTGVEDNPVAKFQRQLDALATVAPNLASQFQGFDLNDPTSREALRKKMIALFDEVHTGQVTAQELGLTQSEFDQLLGQGADFLDSFNQKVQDATKSLTNLPAGINIAALEFQAQAAREAVRSNTNQLLRLNELPLADPRVPVGRRLGDALPFKPKGSDGASLPTIGDMVFTGDFHITIEGAGRTAPQLVEEFKRLLRRESMARFGNPDQGGASI